MSHVVIVKTASDTLLWQGLHPDYPVQCEEFDSAEEAKTKHPDKQVMTLESYKLHSAYFHEKFPFPEPKQMKSPSTVVTKKPWWSFLSFLFFWRRN